jgi:hypothetical protein
MEHTRFVGLDIHKERISVAVAESGRSGSVEYLGEISNDPVAIGKLCERLARLGRPLAFCYEAGPCGYRVYRQLKSLGHRCDVVAKPSAIRPDRYSWTPLEVMGAVAPWERPHGGETQVAKLGGWPGFVLFEAGRRETSTNAILHKSCTKIRAELVTH